MTDLRSEPGGMTQLEPCVLIAHKTPNRPYSPLSDTILRLCSTFAQMLIAALPNAETAGGIATLFFSMALIFTGKTPTFQPVSFSTLSLLINALTRKSPQALLIHPKSIGVMQPPIALPGFWVFMYRLSPLTYLISGIASTSLHALPVTCSSSELARFPPPAGQTCGQYLAGFLCSPAGAAGTLVNPTSTDMCEYCQLSVSDQFLVEVTGIEWGTRWRNYGIGFAYIVFNVGMAVVLYWAFRVKRWRK